MRTRHIGPAMLGLAAIVFVGASALGGGDPADSGVADEHYWPAAGAAKRAEDRIHSQFHPEAVEFNGDDWTVEVAEEGGPGLAQAICAAIERDVPGTGVTVVDHMGTQAGRADC